jgi:predicted dienelactone hydrolase
MQGNLDRTRRAIARLVAMVLVVTAGAAALAPGAEAQDNPHQRGPDPTERLLESRSGPYSTRTENVRSSVRGFGGGTIHYPTTTSDGTFGVVAVSPGYTGTESTIRWVGSTLASHGFVVITIGTNSLFDQPPSRARQLQAALDYVASSSGVRDRIDRDRMAVVGHSMGGGGSLIAADDNSDLRAAVGMTPWTVSNNFRSLDVPTLILAARGDSIAPVSSHASPQYNSIPNSTPKLFLEIRSASHFTPTSYNTPMARYIIAWMKRFVDGDTRYDPFLCGAPHRSYVSGTTISDERNSCPF